MTTTLLSMRAASAATAVFAGGVFAQTDGTFLLVSTNTVSPSSPTTTIKIWAAWDDPGEDFMFGAVRYDLAASDGFFSNPLNILNGPGSSAGVINGNTITGGANQQIWVPSPIIPWPSTPTLLASYTWSTANFTPRTVDLVTSNTDLFVVANIITGTPVYFDPNQITPGTGVINVVPGPGVAVVLVFPLAVLGSRRRAVAS